MKRGVKVILLVVCLLLLFAGGFYCFEYGERRTVNDSSDFYTDANNLINKAESALANKAYKSLVLLDNNYTTINNSGIYELSGSYEEVTINIDCEEEVVLILNNINLSNSKGAVINVENSEAVLLYLLADSENTISSGEEVDILSCQDDNSGAAIYSRDNLYLAGCGSLTINGYINNAVASNDSLLLLSGVYNIKAINNGLKAHNYLWIYDGTYNITSGNDGIKAENNEDVSLGNINIYGGEININAYGDGISALSDLTIEDGSISISSPDYSYNSSLVMTNKDNVEMSLTKPSNNTNDKNFKNNFNRRDEQVNSAFSQPNNTEENKNETYLQENIVETNSDDSNKGLKAGNLIIINGGTLNIVTSDDCIHSDTDIVINGGDYTLASNDDGFHADNTITINDGNILIENSYEGVEGHQIYVYGGNINLTSRDDGFNASGDNGCILTFDGGTVYVDADGDGLDSNGDLIINDGYIIVDGPTNSGNGPLDSGSENGGSLIANGGELLAIGAKGMDESFDSSSSQNFIHLQTSSNYSAGSSISILNEDGVEIFSYTSKKDFSSIVYTSYVLQEDATYYILLNDDTYTLSTNDDTNNYNDNGFSNAGARDNTFSKNKHN